MFKLNDKVVSIYQDLVIGDGDAAITIPAASLQNPATRAYYGITEEPDQPRPDDYWYSVSDNGDGTFTSEPRPLADLKSRALEQIKQARQVALDSFAKSAGISAVYDENLLAAQRFIVGDLTPMRDGQTPTAYLTGMGVKLGMTTEEFSSYVISENTLAAQKAVAVEQVYLDFAYLRLAAATFESIQSMQSELQAAMQAAIGAETGQ